MNLLKLYVGASSLFYALLAIASIMLINDYESYLPEKSTILTYQAEFIIFAFMSIIGIFVITKANNGK